MQRRSSACHQYPPCLALELAVEGVHVTPTLRPRPVVVHHPRSVFATPTRTRRHLSFLVFGAWCLVWFGCAVEERARGRGPRGRGGGAAALRLGDTTGERGETVREGERAPCAALCGYLPALQTISPAQIRDAGTTGSAQMMSKPHAFGTAPFSSTRSGARACKRQAEAGPGGVRQGLSDTARHVSECR
jgi:hypothetical protein